MSFLSITSKRDERFVVLPGHAQAHIGLAMSYAANQPCTATRNEWTRGKVASS